MRYASDLYLDLAVIDSCDHGYVFLKTCIDSSGNKFLHRFSAAYDRYFGIDEFLDDIAAMAAAIEFNSHDIIDLNTAAGLSNTIPRHMLKSVLITIAFISPSIYI